MKREGGIQKDNEDRGKGLKATEETIKMVKGLKKGSKRRDDRATAHGKQQSQEMAIKIENEH